jgi:hypothetical protein
MDEKASRVSSETTGSAPASGSAADGHRPATPWWTAIVGVASGVVSGIAAAEALRPGGDGIAVYSVLALITVPSVVAFLVTAGLARAALRPGGANLGWLASVFALIPLVIIMGVVLGLHVFPWVSYIQDSLRRMGMPFLERWLSLLSWGLPPLVVAALGAALGLWRATAHITGGSSGPAGRDAKPFRLTSSR